MSRGGRCLCIELAAERGCAIELDGDSVVGGITFALLPGTLAGGAPADPARLARQLRAALDAGGIAARHVRVALPDAAMLTRTLRLPPMPRGDLRRAAAFAVERGIPVAPADLVWSWSTVQQGGGGCTIRVVAAWRDVLERLRLAVEGAGLRLDSVESRSAALRSTFGERPTVLLERAGRELHVTATGKDTDSFTAHAEMPGDPAGWPRTLESLVVAARRHLGAAGREAEILVTAELGPVVPAALGARPATEVLRRQVPRLQSGMAGDDYLAVLGLARGEGLLPVPRLARGLAGRQLSAGRVRWIPALAVASIASWSAVAVGAALLLGWHPSWPLAP